MRSHNGVNVSHADAIKTAQMNLLAVRALIGEFVATLNADVPAPLPGCDDATFNAWNDAYEQANADRGGDKLDAAKTAAEDALIEAVSAWIRSMPSTSDDVLKMLAMIPTRYDVRIRCLDLWMRLDTRTVWR